jgi:hypothetical protein
MPGKQADGNREAETMRAITEDLEPTDQTAAVVTGGDAAPVTTTSSMLKTQHDVSQASINKM